MHSRANSSSISESSTSNTSDISLIELIGDSFVQTFNCGVRNNGIDRQTWPGELSDPMAWSAQFLGPPQNFPFNSDPISTAELPPYTQIEGDT